MASRLESIASSMSGHRWVRRSVFAVGGLVALMLVAWLAIPPIVRAQLESRLTEGLGRQTTVESVSFNPLKLRLTVSNLAIADLAGPQPLLAIDHGANSGVGATPDAFHGPLRGSRPAPGVRAVCCA